jgi:hypothetical protein
MAHTPTARSLPFAQPGCRLLVQGCAAILLLALPARADEPPADCVRMGSTVVCEADGFDLLVADLLDAEKARDVAVADRDALARKLAACDAVTKAEPAREVWPLVAVGAVGVALGVVVGVLVAR